MITRQQGLNFLNTKLINKNIIKHMIATEALMGGVFDVLKTEGKTDTELGGSKEEWQMAGLMHDGDYVENVPMDKQGVVIGQWLKESGFDVPDNVVHAMAAHNDSTGTESQNLMDWTIRIGDSLTGLIVASALILPSKKLADVTPEKVLKRFKEKSFARGSRREEIAMCENKLGLPLSEFVAISLKAMQNAAGEIGL